MTAKSFIKKLEIALSERGVRLYYSDGSIKHPEQIVSELYNNSVTLKPIDWDNIQLSPPLGWDDIRLLPPIIHWEDAKPLPPIYLEDAELLPPVVDRTDDC